MGSVLTALLILLVSLRIAQVQCVYLCVCVGGGGGAGSGRGMRSGVSNQFIIFVVVVVALVSGFGSSQADPLQLTGC